MREGLISHVHADITLAQLYSWNPVLGANGENCATDFWAEEGYCVGVSG